MHPHTITQREGVLRLEMPLIENSFIFEIIALNRHKRLTLKIEFLKHEALIKTKYFSTNN